jgi:hypothetical protein
MLASSDEAKRREAELLNQLSDSHREAAAHAAALADAKKKLDKAAKLHAQEIEKQQQVCVCVHVCVCVCVCVCACDFRISSLCSAHSLA